MAGPIQLIPQGLMGLLQLKQSGKLPSELLETVQSTYDLRDQYLQRNVEGEISLFGALPATNAIVTGGHGDQAFLVGGVTIGVPNNEIWYIHSCQALLSGNTIAAADTLTAGVLMGQGAFGQGSLITPVYADVVSARARTWLTPPMFRSVWAPPGSNFFAAVFDILTGTSIVIQLGMQATRLKI